MTCNQFVFRSAWRTLRYSLGCLAACCAVLTLGCKSDPGRELLEQELRYQEDEIYHLENHLDTYKQQVEALKNENSALRNGDPVPARSSSVLPKITPPPGEDRPSNKRRTDASGGSSISVPDVKLGPGSSKLPSVIAPPASPRKLKPEMSAPGLKDSSGPLELPDPSDSRPTSEAPRYEPGASTAPGEQPTQLLLNPRLTGGWAARGSATDEGIRVLLQPATAQGKAVRTPGALSVALIDPALEGEASRVAKWEIPLEQAKELFRQASSEGVKLELRWPGAPPTNRELQLFVRYRSPRGAELVADQSVTINTSGGEPVARRNPYVISDAVTEEDAPTPAKPAPQRPGLLKRMGEESSRLIGRKPTWSPER